jgi:hypothetical protein
MWLALSASYIVLKPYYAPPNTPGWQLAVLFVGIPAALYLAIVKYGWERR